MPRLPVKSRHLLRRYLTPIAMRLLDLRCKYGPDVVAKNGKTCVAVVASYLRPQNINSILLTLVKCEFVSKIVISNNNPDITIEEYIDIKDERIQILNSATRQFPGYRFKLADTLQSDYFVILDDDIFMFPEQIRRLFSHLVNDPAVPHGFHGICYSKATESKHGSRCQHIAGREAVVDVLHQGYAVTNTHIERMQEIAESFAESDTYQYEDPTRFADDILISFSGKSKARVHNLAPILTCPTSLEASISVSGQTGFDRKRSEVFAYLTDKFGHIVERDNA